MLSTEEITDLRAAFENVYIPYGTLHTCTRCGGAFMRKFVKVPLCYKCQQKVRREAYLKRHPQVAQRQNEKWEAQRERVERWTKRANEMRSLYEQGISYQGIAEVYGVTRERVRQIIGEAVVKNGHHRTPSLYEKRSQIEAARYTFASTHPELTTRQLAKQLGVSTGKAVEYWGDIRHAVSSKNKNAKKGAVIEEYVSKLLTRNGIEHTLTNSRPYDIILADGRTVEIKSRHKPDETHQATKNFYFFPLKRVYKKEHAPTADFYIFVIVNRKRDVFIVPKTDLPASMAIGFCWPQTNKSRGKWTQYHNRFDLLKEGE